MDSVFEKHTFDHDGIYKNHKKMVYEEIYYDHDNHHEIVLINNLLSN